MLSGKLQALARAIKNDQQSSATEMNLAGLCLYLSKKLEESLHNSKLREFKGVTILAGLMSFVVVGEFTAIGVIKYLEAHQGLDVHVASNATAGLALTLIFSFVLVMYLITLAHYVKYDEIPTSKKNKEEQIRNITDLAKDTAQLPESFETFTVTEKQTEATGSQKPKTVGTIPLTSFFRNSGFSIDNKQVIINL